MLSLVLKKLLCICYLEFYILIPLWSRNLSNNSIKSPIILYQLYPLFLLAFIVELCRAIYFLSNFTGHNILQHDLYYNFFNLQSPDAVVSINKSHLKGNLDQSVQEDKYKACLSRSASNMRGTMISNSKKASNNKRVGNEILHVDKCKIVTAI